MILSVEAGFIASRWMIGVRIACVLMVESLGAEVTAVPSLGVPTALREGLDAPEFVIPSSLPRFCSFAASHLFLYSGNTSVSYTHLTLPTKRIV